MRVAAVPVREEQRATPAAPARTPYSPSLAAAVRPDTAFLELERHLRTIPAVARYAGVTARLRDLGEELLQLRRAVVQQGGFEEGEEAKGEGISEDVKR